MLKSEWHRFGYACVNFGSPVSMRAYCSSRGVDFQRLSGEARKRETAALGEHLMRSVARSSRWCRCRSWRPFSCAIPSAGSRHSS